MSSLSIRTCILIWTFSGFCVYAGEGPVQIKQVSAEYQEALSILKVECDLVIPPPWHINSDSADVPYLIVTRTSLKDSTAGSMIKKKYPKPKQKKLLGQKMKIFQGNLNFTNYFYLNSPVSFPLEAVLQYQSCDDKMCYPPKYTDFLINNIAGKITVSFPEGG